MALNGTFLPFCLEDQEPLEGNEDKHPIFHVSGREIETTAQKIQEFFKKTFGETVAYSLYKEKPEFLLSFSTEEGLRKLKEVLSSAKGGAASCK